MHSQVRTALLLVSAAVFAFVAGTASVRGADTRVQSAATATARPMAVPLSPLTLPVYTTLPSTCTIGQVLLLQSGTSSYSIQVCVQYEQRVPNCPPIPHSNTSPPFCNTYQTTTTIGWKPVWSLAK